MTSLGKESGADGLTGQWLSLDELAEIDFFRGAKRAFKVKLNTNFAPAAGEREPGIKAAVRREFEKGEVICRAGEYGSTAFLLIEGKARAHVPERTPALGVSGRTRRSLGLLEKMFTRRTKRSPVPDPDPTDVGHVSPYASVSCEQPPPPVALGPGDFFGIDTCVNFYPREATVEAEERCVVIEMLRSVLDTIREAGEAGAKVDGAYRESAIRNTVFLDPLLRGLTDEQRRELTANAELLTPDSDEVRNGVIYAETDASDAVYLVRAGTIKLSRHGAAGEFVFSYLGRGAAFGLESIVPPRQQGPLRLTCVSHPSEVAAVEIGAQAITIGRSSGCDVATPRGNRAVGRRHCRIEERDGDLYVVDLDSANFTLLNGERIREAVLAVGDRITVVDYDFEIGRAPVEAAAGPPARLASASGMDNFEVVKLRGEDLKRLGEREPRFLERLSGIARSLESAAAQRPAPELALLGDVVDLNLYNSQNVLLIDLESCTRCDECVRACADAHGGVARFTRDGPRLGKYLVTMACRSCTDPKCMIGCPVASIRRVGSLEVRIEDWCIGCQRCANQCPFGNINMAELTAPAPPAPAEATPVLRATVCDLCAGYDGPNCVYACPHDAAIRVNPSSFLSPSDRRSGV